MSTLTVVITYSGTLPAEEATSYTSAGTAYDTLTAAEVEAARRLMLKAAKLPGGTAGGYDKRNGRA